jgi:hypothetical protein
MEDGILVSSLLASRENVARFCDNTSKCLLPLLVTGNTNIVYMPSTMQHSFLPTAGRDVLCCIYIDI